MIISLQFLMVAGVQYEETERLVLTKEMVMWRMLAVVAVVVLPAVALRAQTTDRAASRPQIILVLPFEMPPGSTGMWIGRAAQQDLISDLTQATLARVKGPVEPRTAGDADVALKLGKEYKASIVVFGQAQVVDLTVRLTGQILDVANDQVLGALKVTGPLGDLFDIEDALTHETLAALPQAMLRPETLAALQQSGDQPTFFLPMEPSPFQNVGVPMIYDEPQPQKQLTYAPVSTLFNPIAVPYAPGIFPTYGGYYPYSFGYGGFGGFYPGLYSGGLYAGGFYPGFYSPPGYFGTTYPFGWVPAGGVVITNTNSGFGHRRDFRHHGDGDAGNRWNVPGGGGNGVAQGSSPQMVSSGGASIPLQFNWSGPAVGIGGGMSGPAFGPTAIPRGGFAPMPLSGPRFNNFGNQVRGGTVTGR
jgi:TolB-like protein